MGRLWEIGCPESGSSENGENGRLEQDSSQILYPCQVSLVVNGEIYGPVLSQATYRTYEAMEIVRYEKETMAGGITGRQLGSTWGS